MTSPAAEGRVVIVAGPPGAGKSTVAKRLAEGAEGVGGVHLHGDDFLYYVRRGFIDPWRPESHQQNLTITRALASAAFAYADAGYFVAVDWVVGPWFLGVYREASERHGRPLSYVFLRPSEVTVIQRSRDRSSYPIPDYEPLRPLYAQFSELGDLEQNVIDTTHQSVDETYAEVRAGLEAGRFLLV